MSHIHNRDSIVRMLQRELVGPDPSGQPIALDDAQPLQVEYTRQCRTQLNGQEILVQDCPTNRYGVGVLCPAATMQDTNRTDELEPGQVEGLSSPASEAITSDASATVEAMLDRDMSSRGPAETGDDLDLAGANTFRPSTMAITFRISIARPCTLTVMCEGGTYRPIKVTGTRSSTPPVAPRDASTSAMEDQPLRTHTWWARQPWSARALTTDANLRVKRRRRLTPKVDATGLDQHKLEINIIVRPEHAATTLVTVAVVNRTARPTTEVDAACLFQVSMKVLATDETGAGTIIPQQEQRSGPLDDEDDEIRLLYRRRQTYAIGHGCAADWEVPERERVREVWGASLPVVEIPNTTSDIYDASGERLTASMLELSMPETWTQAERKLARIVDAYQAWIADRYGELVAVPEQLQAAARRNLDQCREAHARMVGGLALLASRLDVREAFQTMNRAMLIQQIRTAVKGARKLRGGGIEDDYLPNDAISPPSGKGSWRAFQIAFILMNLVSFDSVTSSERTVVDLIWFPTGGGKTEAYLALAAFHILMERSRGRTNRDGSGTAVLMRYTLRLLTAQQFQRAAALICALEYLRRMTPERWGARPLTIGVWVGMTPNSRLEAQQTLARLARGDETNKTIVVLERCPWCRALLGAQPVEPQVGSSRRGTKRRAQVVVHGYRREGDTVVAYCPDARCPFSARLPILFVDDDIYDEPPTFLIGTVDKFAMLAWRPEARSLFGRDDAGQQVRSPPGLIIQDEFHMISGPLGSMVGLYELAIDELCTDRRGDTPVFPKLITSTATVRRFKQQVRAVFGRTEVRVFPPPALEAGESFFSRTDSQSRGKFYMGVNAPGLGSMQTTQVRVFSALLQAAQDVGDEGRDPWWTMMGFFNSLRELGAALTLFNSGIPDYVGSIRTRYDLSWSAMRRLKVIRELTGRLEDREVVEALGELETPYAPDRKVVDVCLASNIIEVGVDIDRLSLMTVIGQPKTTAQYIQVTGRVGRNWVERPGLVVTIYGVSKPRDRSHFEKFRTYHERLYAQVEPTSVTPMSRRALERALHAVLTILIRHTASIQATPATIDQSLLLRAGEVIRRRLGALGLAGRREELDLEHVLQRRIREFQAWQPHACWQGEHTNGAPPILRYPGRWWDAPMRARSWETPTSMRFVDAECSLRISQRYIDDTSGETS